jgi:hypothetical protein
MRVLANLFGTISLRRWTTALDIGMVLLPFERLGIRKAHGTSG